MKEGISELRLCTCLFPDLPDFIVHSSHFPSTFRTLKLLTITKQVETRFFLYHQIRRFPTFSPKNLKIRKVPIDLDFVGGQTGLFESFKGLNLFINDVKLPHFPSSSESIDKSWISRKPSSLLEKVLLV